ncbi:MAG: serpin family protein, partial [Gammaproteobacteria bacterium]|nr:serpin family protein [Gemmatimonadota bacterium]NIU80595.1 serpin family protein [Gammaproteobacteria bacterium]
AAEDEPNVFLSPLSASMALGMALVGADGDAYDAMQSTLGLAGLTEEEVQTSYRDLIDLLVTLDPAVEFDIANSAWAKLGIPFHDAY